jgi:hypothetical protein
VAKQLPRQAVVAAVKAKQAGGKGSSTRTTTLTFRTAKKWTVVVTVPKKKATDAEVLEELTSVLDQLRLKVGRAAA